MKLYLTLPPDILDSALVRPGRIDRKIEFPPPGPEARVAILRIHSRKVRVFLRIFLSFVYADVDVLATWNQLASTGGENGSMFRC